MSFDHLEELLQNPPITARTEVRWWLAEALHTDQTLVGEVDAAYRMGFGGMEFLAMDEPGIDHEKYGWGSEEWKHDSQRIVEETTARGMAVSFTSGTNWSNANLPTIDADHPAASHELDVVWEDVPGAARRTGPLPRVDLEADRGKGVIPGHRVAPKTQTFVAAVAVPLVATTDEGGRIDISRAIVLTETVTDHTIDWLAPDGDTWRLFAFWAHGTGQTASPSASVNYTVNYLDPDGAEAVIAYWSTHVLTPELKASIEANPRPQMYMDSLELTTWGEGGMFWGHTFAEEFRERRGYEIWPWLPVLTRSVSGFSATTRYRYEPLEEQQAEVEKVRYDYVRTLTDLYIDNMLRPLATYLHDNGMTLRAEISYGLPFELSRPGAVVDGIETESLEFGAQIDAYRLLAGAAHLFGKEYSSETGATARNYMLDHRFYDQIIATQFAAGVTRTVLHGWASTTGAEGSTSWPGHEGMWSMFSERFDTRQPSAEFYPLWNAAMARKQLLLSHGRPRVDVGILRTDHFVDNMSGMHFVDESGTRVTDEHAYGNWWMRNRQNHWWQDLGMQDAGWTYDFLDGELLLDDRVTTSNGVVQPDGPGYQALIIYQEALDPDVAARLLELARAGVRILIVNGATDLRLLAAHQYTRHAHAASRTPGRDGRDEELAHTMAQLRELPSVAEIDDPAQTLTALRELGIVGRAEFAEPHESVLTCLRDDGQRQHLYVYNFQYEKDASASVDIVLPGALLISQVDPWTGMIHPYRDAIIDHDQTRIPVHLAPGETAFFVSEKTMNAAVPSSKHKATVTVTELADWDITIESWDAGDTEILTEDRGLGYLTREERPLTHVTPIDAGTGPLRTWTDLPGVGPDVSGIGDYSTTFDWEPEARGGRILLDLGSTSGSLGSISINEQPPRGFDTSRPVIDITDLVKPGENTIRVRVASSLNNRLLARGYYTPMVERYARAGHPTPDIPVRPYGLIGPVRVITETEPS